MRVSIRAARPSRRSTAATLDAVLALAERADAVTTTSVGRLFDAVAVLLGGRTRVTYEAQAAIELEALARSAPRAHAPIYEVDVDRPRGTAELDPSPMIAAIVARSSREGSTEPRSPPGSTSRSADATVALAARAASDHDIDTVVLTGGVFQNALLTEVVESGLIATGVRVLIHAVVPPNDGGISVGQAAIAGWRLRAG